MCIFDVLFSIFRSFRHNKYVFVFIKKHNNKYMIYDYKYNDTSNEYINKKILAKVDNYIKVTYIKQNTFLSEYIIDNISDMILTKRYKNHGIYWSGNIIVKYEYDMDILIDKICSLKYTYYGMTPLYDIEYNYNML